MLHCSTGRALILLCVGLGMPFTLYLTRAGDLDPPLSPASSFLSLSDLFQQSQTVRTSAACAGGVLTADPTFPGATTLVRIPGVLGSSTDPDHPGWIPFFSFGQNITNPAILQPGATGIDRGRANLSSITLTKSLSKASPRLTEVCANGDRFPEVTIEVFTGSQLNYRVALTDVLIEAVSRTTSSEGGQLIPVEEVTLNFKSIEWTYKTLDSEGNEQGTEMAGWNRETDTES